MLLDIILLEATLGFAIAAAWALAEKGLPLFGPTNPNWVWCGIAFTMLGITCLLLLVGRP